MQQYLRLLRISHWIKNLFLFLPLFFSGQIFRDWRQTAVLLLGFLCFSAIASAIYIFNDIRDREADRSHPEKKNRPFASGTISVSSGAAVSVILTISSLAGSFFIDTDFFLVLCTYFGINILYSAGLKHIAIIDITLIAIGFLLRIVAGGVIADIPVSHWILIMTFLLAMFLGLAKRRDDVLIFNESGQKMRKSLDGYNLDFINACMVIMSAVVIVSYIMYTFSPDVIQRMRMIGSEIPEYLYLTGLFVILGIMRYLQIAFVLQKSGSPTKVLLKDLFIQLVLIGWILAFFFILYSHKLMQII